MRIGSAMIGSLWPGILAEASDGGAEGHNTWWEIINYQFLDNELWRYGLFLLVIIITLAAGRVLRFVIDRSAKQFAKREAVLFQLFLRCLTGPAAVAVFAGGLYLSRLTFRFAIDGRNEGFGSSVHTMWLKISQAVMALAVAYFIYRLVDILEHYLHIWTGKTKTALDEMLVPIVRKSLRIFIAAISALFIADNILGLQLGTILAAAGVGGLAVALAAQETIANFFGSVNIFADRPFQVGERIRLDTFDGPVEEVGFRSTRIRTLDGHLVSVPNRLIANEKIENIGRRPYIRRVANITITYNTPPDKVEKAVAIIQNILAGTAEVHHDPDLTPKVFFSDFNDWSLNILVIYWVKPPDYWLFQQVNQQVNLAIMRAFETENIEFAYPTQTLYFKKDDGVKIS